MRASQNKLGCRGRSLWRGPEAEGSRLEPRGSRRMNALLTRGMINDPCHLHLLSSFEENAANERYWAGLRLIMSSTRVSKER